MSALSCEKVAVLVLDMPVLEVAAAVVVAAGELTEKPVVPFALMAVLLVSNGGIVTEGLIVKLIAAPRENDWPKGCSNNCAAKS